MKPPPFDYADPESLDEMLDLLADAGDDAAIIAGGQSLIPLLNLRLARPELILDCRHVPDLHGFELSPAGLRAGAMAGIADLELHRDIDQVPGLGQAIGHIGHRQIRARTTVGGSIAHADPAAELPALLVALDGEVTLRSRDRGRRVVAAQDFFEGPLMTARAADEIVTSVWLPAQPASMVVAEVAKRPGDFAIAGAIAGYRLEAGAVDDPRIVLFGVAGTPVRLREAEDALRRSGPSADGFAAAADAVRDHLDTHDDAHGSADYRRHVAATLVERALIAA